jgi:Ca2+-binding RTX toxin-like protein
MPEGIIKQTTKAFVMNMADGEGVFRQVEVHGVKLTYDATGAITGGIITNVRYNTVLDDGKTVQVVDQTLWAALNVEAGALVDIFQNTFWNHIKVVTERFALLDGLHGGVLRSHFTTKDAILNGTDKGEGIQGSFRNDTIDGRDGDDRLMGRAGNDSLNGGDGNDRMLGGLGDDVLTDSAGKTNTFSAGQGDDSMFGGLGNDQMSGDIGSDLLFGHGGQDVASGGRGADRFVFDTKEAGTLRIYDFTLADDVLVNLRAATAKEAFTDFMDHATQVGRNVEYRDGEQTVVLLRAHLNQLLLENFAGGDVVPELLL